MTTIETIFKMVRYYFAQLKWNGLFPWKIQFVKIVPEETKVKQINFFRRNRKRYQESSVKAPSVDGFKGMFYQDF